MRIQHSIISVAGLAVALLSSSCQVAGSSPEEPPRVARPSPTDIPGYTYGAASLPSAPVSAAEFERLKQTVLFDEDDVRALRQSRVILADQVDEILDVWYGFVASTPQLVEYFKNTETGEPDAKYLAAVRRRFGQWILDTADAQFDQEWLNYQFEIGRRHHHAKNQTDGVSSVPIVHFRYLVALYYPITTTLRPFLQKGGRSTAEVHAMDEAWRKAVLLQVILWCHPYVKDREF